MARNEKVNKQKTEKKPENFTFSINFTLSDGKFSMVPKCFLPESWSESSKIIERLDPIYHDFKSQVLSALTNTQIVQCCPCQDINCEDPECPLSDIDTQSMASPAAAAPTLPTCSTPSAATPALPTCSTPSPATTPSPTTSSRLENLGSHPDYDTFVAMNAALSGATGVAIKN